MSAANISGGHQVPSPFVQAVSQIRDPQLRELLQTVDSVKTLIDGRSPLGLVTDKKEFEAARAFLALGAFYSLKDIEVINAELDQKNQEMDLDLNTIVAVET